MSSANVATPADLFSAPDLRKDIADLVVMGPKSGVWIWELATNQVDWSPPVYAIFNVVEFDNTLESFQRLIYPHDILTGTDEIMRAVSSDTIFQTSFRVLKRVLDLSASFLVLVHNHPSGDPKPSNFDIAMTNATITTARGLGITVADHIILAKCGHTSMKNLGLLD